MRCLGYESEMDFGQVAVLGLDVMPPALAVRGLFSGGAELSRFAVFVALSDSHREG